MKHILQEEKNIIRLLVEKLFLFFFELVGRSFSSFGDFRKNLFDNFFRNHVDDEVWNDIFSFKLI